LDICRRAVEIAESDKAAAEKAALEAITEEPNDEIATIAPAKAAVMKKGVVTISTIKRAINEATSTPLAAYLRSLPLASKLFLAALLGRIRRTGLTESTLGDIIDEAARMAALSSLVPLHDILLAPDTFQPIPSLNGVSTPGKRGRAAGKKEGKVARLRGMNVAAEELAEAGIVGLEVRRGERVGRVRLGVGEEEIRGALREDEECRGLGFNG
ncbi:origin of replication binding protein, partial [Aureobasidium melanogenum]